MFIYLFFVSDRLKEKIISNVIGITTKMDEMGGVKSLF